MNPVKVERWDVLRRADDRIHRWNCRYATSKPEWNYWQDKGVWEYENLQVLIATDAPWLKACKVCKPTGWVEVYEPV